MKVKQRSVLQDWVMNLGLRHQGVLVSGIRGYDCASKDDPIKLLTRSFRDAIMVSFDTKPSSFIDKVPTSEIKKRMEPVLGSMDQYHWHYLEHLLFASEIIGYYHPYPGIREIWNWFYTKAVKKIHLNPETKDQMDSRLNADEESFSKKQHEEFSNELNDAKDL
jgi:hypothetical protein